MALSKIKSDSIDSIAATKLTGTVDNARITLDAAEIPNLDAAKITTGDIALARLGNVPATADEITKSTSDPLITTNPAGGVGTMWLRTTTGEMYCCTDATTDNNVWTNIGGGTGNIFPFTGMATTNTNGTVTTDGDYKVVTFNTGGTLTVTTVGSIGTIDYLVVAGGGGGCRRSTAGGDGGGGAGGYLTATGLTVSASTYTIQVGGGGAGTTSANGDTGTN